MSRVGSQQIKIPESVEVSFSDGVLKVKGPKGELERKIRSWVEVSIDKENNLLTFAPLSNSREVKALWGTYASHAQNMIQGVTEGFSRKLSVEGVGYKSEQKDDNIVLYVGFSHPVEMKIPEGLEAVVDKASIEIKGIGKESVGDFAAKIRAVKKPEPYKGKGIRYEGEIVKMKEGKKS